MRNPHPGVVGEPPKTLMFWCPRNSPTLTLPPLMMSMLMPAPSLRCMWALVAGRIVEVEIFAEMDLKGCRRCFFLKPWNCKTTTKTNMKLEGVVIDASQKVSMFADHVWMRTHFFYSAIPKLWRVPRLRCLFLEAFSNAMAHTSMTGHLDLFPLFMWKSWKHGACWQRLLHCIWSVSWEGSV